ncbi:hypothetical protein PGQ11_010257 [Apiospora arundinis]
MEALRSCWSEPENAVVEVSEGEFQPVVGPFTFHQAVQSLLLVPFRQFPYLSTKDAPRVDGDEVVPAIRPGCLSLLYKRAQLFGFRNKRIDEGAALPADESTPICEDVPCEGASVVAKNRRWGRPHTRTLRVIQQVGFLPQLADSPGWSCEPSVLLVFRSFFQAFLGPCTVSLDRQKPTVSLNYQAAQRGDPTAKPNTWLCRTVSPSEHGDAVMVDASRDVLHRVQGEADRPSPASPGEAVHGALDEADPLPDEDTYMTDSSPVRDTCMADSPDEDSCMLDSPAPDIASQADGYSEPLYSSVPTQRVLPSLASLFSDPGLGHPGSATTIASGSPPPSLPLSPERPAAFGSPQAFSMMSPALARGSAQDWRTTRSDYSILAPSRRGAYWNSMTTQLSAHDGPFGAPASPRLPRLPPPDRYPSLNPYASLPERWEDITLTPDPTAPRVPHSLLGPGSPTNVSGMGEASPFMSVANHSTLLSPRSRAGSSMSATPDIATSDWGSAAYRRSILGSPHSLLSGDRFSQPFGADAGWARGGVPRRRTTPMPGVFTGGQGFEDSDDERWDF